MKKFLLVVAVAIAMTASASSAETLCVSIADGPTVAAPQTPLDFNPKFNEAVVATVAGGGDICYDVDLPLLSPLADYGPLPATSVGDLITTRQ